MKIKHQAPNLPKDKNYSYDVGDRKAIKSYNNMRKIKIRKLKSFTDEA